MVQFIRDWFDRYFSNPQVIILGLLLLAGFLFVFVFGSMLAPVLAAVVIAFLLEGIVGRLQRLRVPRRAAVLLVFLLFMASMLFLLIWLLPLLSRQVAQLIQDLPSMIALGQKEMMRLPERYPDLISQSQIAQIIEVISAGLTRLGQEALSLSLASVRGLITIIVYLILVPLLVFFFLKDKEPIMRWGQGFLPGNRGLATEVWRDVNEQVVNYVRGKIWEILIVWGVTWITFQLFDLRFSILLSLFVGLSVLVPYIGATVMFLPVGFVAFIQWGWGPHFIWAMVAYSIIQALDGNLLVPLLLSEVVNLHPVAIIVAVLLFGGLWGIMGLFFAIPLATLVHAVIKVLVTTYSGRDRGQPTNDDAAPAA